MTHTLEGGCACGRVRYRIHGRPVLVAACCCSDCTRYTGAVYTVWVGVHDAMIEMLGEPPLERETSPVSKRGHCPACGTSLTFRRIGAEAERDPLFYVTAASLDDPDAVEPTEVIYYAERPHWFDIPPNIPRHPGPSPEYGSARRHGKGH